MTDLCWVLLAILAVVFYCWQMAVRQARADFRELLNRYTAQQNPHELAALTARQYAERDLAQAPERPEARPAEAKAEGFRRPARIDEWQDSEMADLTARAAQCRAEFLG